MGRTVTLALALVVLPGLAFGAGVGERQAVVEAMRQWESAVESRDYDRLENYYTEDAIYYPNKGPAVIGRDEIVARNRNRGTSGQVEIDQQVQNVEVKGDWAIYNCLATIRVTPPGKETSPPHHVRVLLVMEKGADGQWRIHRDIDNEPPETETPD